MIDHIERDYSMSTEAQKRKIKKEYARQGKKVTLVLSLGNGIIMVMYTEDLK